MKRRKILRKWTAMALSASLCICLLVVTMASGEQNSSENTAENTAETQASGDSESVDGTETAGTAASAKEEVVYTRLAADGSPLHTYVVNIFPGGEITDYGSYSSVKILNTTDEITQNNDRITFTSSADRVYYQGELEDAVLPWDISIRYFLDGEEYAPDEIAGASGALEIQFEIVRNENCGGSFYDTYALQASFTLNTELCSDIQAEGATIANVGNEKQITYTILPGAGISAVITANVTDFEMDAVSVNGIRMNLDIDIDDEDLMEQITELTDAVGEIDDGTGEVEGGVGTLQENAEDALQAGVNALDEGAGELQSGAGALVSGAEEVSSGAAALDEGTGGLQSGAETLVNGGAEISSGAAALSSGADTLDQGVQSLNSGIAQMQSGLDELNEQSDTLTGGSSQIRNALQQLQASLSEISVSADEIQELVSASSAVKQGISDLSDGASVLQSSISYEAYKTAMAGYGLDIDTLLAGNETGVSSIEETIVQLQALRDALAGSESALAMLGLPADAVNQYFSMLGLSADAIDQYIALLEQMETLLNGNTAALQGMESYLNAANAGAAELAAGAAELKESYETFDAAIGSLANTLTNLLYGMTELKDAVDTLVEAYTGLDAGLTAYTDGVAEIVAGYSRISDGAASLASGSSELVSGSSSLYSGTTELLAGMEELYDASGTLKTGTVELAAGTTELLTGMTELYGASGTLKAGTVELQAGTAELLTGIDALYDGISELKDGTEELRTATSDMDSRVEEQIDAILDSISGGDGAVVSFVSEKNTEVSSVQFVIQTEAVEAAEAETVAEAEEELTFWQRILRLFGLYENSH